MHVHIHRHTFYSSTRAFKHTHNKNFHEANKCLCVRKWESQEARDLLKRLCEVTIRFRTDHTQCSHMLVKTDDRCINAKSNVLIVTIFQCMRSSFFLLFFSFSSVSPSSSFSSIYSLYTVLSAVAFPVANLKHHNTQ